jgi:proteic killer suppression protein
VSANVSEVRVAGRRREGGRIESERRAARLDDLTIPAGKRLERLKGQRALSHSIRVNDQYRLTFRWESGHAYEVCVEDYH